MEDADLIARVLIRKDQHAFGELVKRHQSMVRGLLRKWLGENNAEADDLAQQTMVKAYDKLEQYNGESRFAAWLCQIAYREYLVWRRSARFHEDVDDPALPQGEARVGSSFDLRHDLKRALKTLSWEERMAVICCSMQGMSHAEAAVVTGWPLGTVKTHVLRGKEKLRALMTEWQPRVKL